MKKRAEQVFTMSNGVVVVFTDHHETHIATRAQPRDINIISVTKDGKALLIREKDLATLKEKIAIDIRIGQGFPAVGAARNLLTR